MLGLLFVVITFVATMFTKSKRTSTSSAANVARSVRVRVDLKLGLPSKASIAGLETPAFRVCSVSSRFGRTSSPGRFATGFPLKNRDCTGGFVRGRDLGPLDQRAKGGMGSSVSFVIPKYSTCLVIRASRGKIVRGTKGGKAFALPFIFLVGSSFGVSSRNLV